MKSPVSRAEARRHPSVGTCVLAGLALSAAAAAIAGCIKADSTITLNRDGSGSLDLSYAIAEEAVTRAKAMFRLRDQMAVAEGRYAPRTGEPSLQALFFDPVEDKIRARLKPYEKNGIAVDKLKVQTRNAWRNVTLHLRFANLQELAKTDLFADWGFDLRLDGAGNYTLVRAAETEGKEKIPPLTATEARDLVPLLAGFEVNVKVVTPAPILSASAPRKSERTALWTFNFDDDHNAVVNMQNQPFEIVFEGKGLTLPAVARPAAPRKN